RRTSSQLRLSNGLPTSVLPMPLSWMSSSYARSVAQEKGTDGIMPDRSACRSRCDSRGSPGSASSPHIRRPPEQRLQSGPVDLLIERTSGRAPAAHRPIIQLLDPFMDRLVQLGPWEEPPVAQPRQDPTLPDLHA